jgi:quinol monooxygenase YgiN
MALIIAGTIDVEPSELDEVMPHLVEMMVASNAESGCIDYSFTRDEIVPGRIRLFEKWESDEALAAHFASPHMATFQAAASEFSDLGRELAKYGISSEEVL